MNATEYPRYKSYEACPCKCKCPPSTRIGDRVISRKPKRNGLIRVERYCDCLFCGPFSFEVEVLPEFKDGKLDRSGGFSGACRPLGTPKNAGIRRRD